MEYRSLLNQSALDVDIDDITISGDHNGGFLHVHSSTGLIDPIVAGTQFSIAGDVLQLINLNSLNTGMLTEGINLYYTDARSRGAISAGSGISYNSSTGVISSTGGGVLSISGTANQVLANGTSGSAQTGAVTLTLPQPIGITSAVRFGSIAVGTYSAYPLHIVSGNGYMLGDLSSTYAAQYVGVTSGGAEIRIYGDNSGNAHIGTITNHDFAFRTNDTAKMWLTNTGYLGIGVYPTSGVYLDVYSLMYVRDANSGLKITTSLGVNYIESASAGMSGSADLRFTDMNAANTWMTIKATTGNIGVGVTSPTTKMHIQTSGTTTNQMLTIENAVTSSAGQPTVLLKRSRGTISSQTTLVNGDTIGALTFQGYDGSNYISAASISALNDTTVGTNSMPTALVFRTTPSGGVSTVENMRITSGGLVSIGGVLSDTVSKLEVIDTNNLGITINAPNPRYNMYESDAAANEKWWDQLAIAGTLSFRAVNDAQSAASNWMVVDRTGTTIDSISFPNGKVGIGTTAPGTKLQVTGDANILSNWKLAQLRIGGATNSNYQLNMGYDTTANEAVIQAGEDGIAWRNICLNPFGGNVGIGSTGPASVLQVVTNNSAEAGNYGKCIQTVRETTGASHITMVRAGMYRWSLGFLYNTNTFAIFNGVSATDSSNTSAAFTIDTSNNASFSSNLYVGGTTGSTGLILRGADNALGSYIKIQNTAKTGSNCYEWVMYNMGSAYGNGLQFWRYPASGGSYNPVTFADTGHCYFNNGGVAVTIGQPIQFNGNPASLDNSIHMVNGFPYGLRISGANDGANHRNTQFGYYDAGTWQNRFDFDGYSGWFFIANRTSVPGTPSGGGFLYVESGALKYKGSSGTVTTIAPA